MEKFTVTIKFSLDEKIIEMAIRNLLYLKRKVNKKEIIDIIKSKIRYRGAYIRLFPEEWGFELLSVDDDVVNVYLNKYLPKFNIEN